MSLDTFFDPNSPNYNGAINLPTPPSAANGFTDGIDPSQIGSGELQGDTTVQDGFLQSSNFETGVAGWKISANGDVEFSSGTFRGNVVLGSGGYMRSGQTDFNTGTGWWIGNDGGTPKLSIGNPSDNYFYWDGTELVINGFAQTNIGTFGGDGSDGALDISSGTTDIDLGAATIVVKNYTSISITGTGKLTFSNPHANGTVIIIKCQGDVTVTSTATCIDASGMGAIGGAAVARSSNGSSNGNSGTNGTTEFTYWTTGSGGGASVEVGGAAGSILSGTLAYKTANTVYSSKYPFVFTGSGGGSGSARWTTGSTAGTVTSAGGGRGGGALIIECAGAWNFTTASGISVAGATGTAANQGGTNRASGGGSGGGSGGYCLVMYNTLTANSGTIVISGGAGRNGVANYTGGADTGAGAGGSGGATTAGTAGTNGGTSSVGNGSAGSVGYSLVMLNTVFS